MRKLLYVAVAVSMLVMLIVAAAAPAMAVDNDVAGVAIGDGPAERSPVDFLALHVYGGLVYGVVHQGHCRPHLHAHDVPITLVGVRRQW